MATSRVRSHRDAAPRKPLAEGDAERLEWLLEQGFVLALPRLKPCPIVVLGQVDEELDGFGSEAGEGGCGNGRGRVLLGGGEAQGYCGITASAPAQAQNVVSVLNQRPPILYLSPQSTTPVLCVPQTSCLTTP
jgi:hypothetical protein